MPHCLAECTFRSGLVAVATVGLLSAHVVAFAESDVFAELAQVRRATMDFRSIDAATKAGYGQFQDCVDEHGQGAMGIHFVHGEYVNDTVIDALHPEALMYERDENGRLRFVGVEYIVFKDAWDAENAAPPTLFGEEFHVVPFPNRYGIPAFYELHAWIWRHNPAGVFYEWNPKVHCH